MPTIYLHSMRRSAGAILGWGLSLASLGYLLMGFYDTFAGQQEQMQALLAQYPVELMAFFGGMSDLFTPSGYLTVEFFSYMPLVLGIFAVMGGSGLLVPDEEAGILDLTLSHPVSRTGLFLGRLLAFITSLLLILGLTWFAFVIAAIQVKGFDLNAGDLIKPFISLFSVLFLFGGLSLLLSMILPSRSLAGMIGGLLLTGSYFIQSLSGIMEDLQEFAEYLPLRYYQSGEALIGLNGEWLLGLFGFGLLFILLAWLLFLKRDLRVSGEGSWRLSTWLKTRRQKSKV